MFDSSDNRKVYNLINIEVDKMPTKINNRWNYNINDIRELQEHNFFNPNLLPDDLLEKIINKIEKEKFSVWSQNLDFFNKLPKEHANAVICFSCGILYLVTPLNDAYKTDFSLGRVCNICLLKNVS